MIVRGLAVLIGSVLLGLLAVPAAHAKEDVRATLIGPFDRDAHPGERIRVGWKLEDAEGRPFGAGGLFVRLRSAAGGRPVTAVTQGSGRFSVRLAVPEGGIGALEFGLQGWRTAGGRTSRADVMFPLENDPFAVVRARSTSAAAPAEDDPRAPWLAVAIGACATGAIVAAGVRARAS